MEPAVIGFWILALISVATALGVVLHRSPIRAALFLVLNFICLAILYVMMNAQVLAALQVLVYAGAIMVLFLFVVQLLNLGGETSRVDPLVGQRIAGLGLGALLLWGLIASIQSGYPAAARLHGSQSSSIPQIQVIGWELFTRYVYPFELTSILLLVGVIGVMILTKRRPIPGAADAGEH